MLKGDTVFHSLVIITTQLQSYPWWDLSCGFQWTCHTRSFGHPSKSFSNKRKIKQTNKQVSKSIPLACELSCISSRRCNSVFNYFKVMPEVSRTCEGSFVLDILPEQLWEVFVRVRCECTEQTWGRRGVDKQRSEWLCFSLRATDFKILLDQLCAPK